MISLLEGLATTRAIRRYTDEPIPEDDLATILWHATRAPSGSNRQPFRFVVLRDGPGPSRPRRCWDGRSGRCGRPSAPPTATKPARGRRGRRPRPAWPARCSTSSTASRPPRSWCSPAWSATATRTRPRAQASTRPARTCCSPRALGYGGVMTTWHAFVEPELRTLLGIPAEVAIAATIPLGRPAGHHGPVRRRPLAELVYEDRWDGTRPGRSTRRARATPRRDRRRRPDGAGGHAHHRGAVLGQVHGGTPARGPARPRPRSSRAMTCGGWSSSGREDMADPPTAAALAQLDLRYRHGAMLSQSFVRGRDPRRARGQRLRPGGGDAARPLSVPPRARGAAAERRRGGRAGGRPRHAVPTKPGAPTVGHSSTRCDGSMPGWPRRRRSGCGSTRATRRPDQTVDWILEHWDQAQIA